MTPQYEIIQRYDDRPWESIAGPFEAKQDAKGQLAASVEEGQPNPDYHFVRAPGVLYLVVPVGERP